MSITNKIAANEVGASLVACTQSLSDAVQHACAAIVAMTVCEGETDNLGAARREAKRLHQVLGAIMDTRQSQIHARINSLKLGQELGFLRYGESCTCAGLQSDTTNSSHDTLRLVS